MTKAKLRLASCILNSDQVATGGLRSRSGYIRRPSLGEEVVFEAPELPFCYGALAFVAQWLMMSTTVLRITMNPEKLIDEAFGRTTLWARTFFP
jgi:hypothetical protein